MTRQITRRLHLSTLLLVLLCWTGLSAQTTTRSMTDAYTPIGLSPGTPAGSFALSGFDTVNAFNGNLNFRLPLHKMEGRGEVAHTIFLSVAERWRIEVIQHQGFQPLYSPTINWWDAMHAGYGPGVLSGRKTGSVLWCGINYHTTFTRLTFTTPDGTEMELRDQLNDGAAGYGQEACGGGPGLSRGRVFVTQDGTAATFISDWEINDAGGNEIVAQNGYEHITPSGFLMLRNGTRYRIDNGRVSWIRDRNGNKITFTYDIFSRVTSMTDSLKRTVTIVYGVNDGFPYGVCDRITYKGTQGTTRIIRVSKTSLSNALRSGQLLKTYGGLFPDITISNTTFNPTVFSAVWLPDGRSYQFKYNSYAELARVVLPTGGAYEYDWAAGATGGPASGTLTNFEPKSVYRRVIERRVYPDGVNMEGRTTFSRPEFRISEGNYGTAGFVTVENFDPAGALKSATKHHFHGSATASLIRHFPNWTTWKEGKEHTTEQLDLNGTVLMRTVNDWQQGVWLNPAGNGNDAMPVNPRIVESFTTIEPSGANLVSKKSAINPQNGAVGFDIYNNQTDVWEYDFGVGAPGGLIRRSHTDFVATNPVNGFDYACSPTSTCGNNPNINNVIHLRSLPSQVQVFDAAGNEKARTNTEYDNYVDDGSRALLVDRFNIHGLDPSFTTNLKTRGNATRGTNWILSTGTQLHSFSQYDIAGNITKLIDARGFPTTFEFADQFGTADNEVRSNFGPTDLAGQSAFAFPTKITNALGHEVYIQYDYYLGRRINAEDPNGIISSAHYADVLDRPTQMKKAVGTGLANQTTFSYDDVSRIVTVTSDRDTNNDNILTSKTLYDGLGRVLENRQYEGGTNYIATQQQYDALGRAFKISNPFRPWQGESAVWTTSTFDALGRVLSVTTPDNSVATTSYSGNTVTSTDQAGRKHKNVTDALGRLKEVYEDPLGLNYLTSYTYDVLDNLTNVNQGIQTRTFVYDSLKRLVSATNPESGTVSYQYDANGNLTQKTDARPITTTFVYDALNRITSTNYSDTAVNPDLTLIYDTATNGKGRIRESYAGGNEITGAIVEHTRVVSYDALGRPTDQRQRFKTSSVWGAEFQTQRGYNLAGGITAQIYPSGRAVNYGYDSSGRLTTFTGNLGDSINRNYSTEIIYSPRGGIVKEKFGTDTPIYNKTFYNNRGQKSEIRVGTTYTGPTDSGWQRGAIINHYSGQCWGACSGTDNNGNLRQQDHWIPDSNGGVQGLFVQNYAYDGLNRLQRVVENTLQQEFVYDRYGNRTIHQANTWGTGVNKKDFTVIEANNRLGVPLGQVGTMTYDNAGNLVNDTYTGAGSRVYDAENRMTKAWGGNNQWQEYTYNAGGQRTRRKIDGVETRQVYGLDGELLAEYGAGAAPSTPQKEYGYRSGELLVVATVPVAAGTGLRGQYFDNINFTGLKVTRTDATVNYDWGGGTPDPNIGVDTFTVRWEGKVEPQFSQTYTFYTFTDDGVRLWVNGQLLIDKWIDQGPTEWSGQIALTAGQRYDIVMEFYEHGGGATAKLSWSSASQPKQIIPQARLYPPGGSSQVTVDWLVADQLGTPRIILDKTGSLAETKRHDYLPFGEELFAGIGGRTPALGYTADTVRQQFTGKERDTETGLDYFGARYFASIQGRFTSADAIWKDSQVGDPQSWNKYAYARNNPLRYIDPSGEKVTITIETDEKTKKGTVKIEASIAIYSHGNSNLSAQQLKDARDAIESAIEEAWTGSFTDDGMNYTVTTDVTVTVHGSEGEAVNSGAQNVIGISITDSIPGKAISHVDQRGSGASDAGPDRGIWRFDRVVNGRQAAHEFTHILGAHNTQNRANVSFSPWAFDLTPMSRYGNATGFDYRHALSGILYEHREGSRKVISPPCCPYPGVRLPPIKSERLNRTSTREIVYR